MFSFPSAVRIGGRGVGIFFVISGYLITTRLLRERERTGAISLRGFYLRRFFRLMPCVWLYLALLGLCGALQPLEAAGCLFFFRCGLPTSASHPLTGQFWSLSIEEDFYLLWPSALIYLGKRKGLALAAAGALFLGIQGTILLAFFRPAIMVGCAAALIPVRPLSFSRWIMAASLLTFLACVCLTPGDTPTLLESIAVGFLIWSTASDSSSWLARGLSWRPLVWVGVISYSIYVWQQPFTLLGPHRLATIPLRLAGAMGAGILSYYFIERPCIRPRGEAARAGERSLQSADS